jgi:G3E family GTPase
VGTVAAVIDGGAMLANFEKYKSYFEGQIASADVLFVNRTGALADRERLTLAELIQAVNPHVRIVAEPFSPEVIWCALDAPAENSGIIAAGLPKAWLRQFKQLSVETGWDGSLEKLQEFFHGNGFGELIRAKGYVYDAGGVRYHADLAGGELAFEPAGTGGPDCVQLIGRNLSISLIKQYFGHL